MKQSQYDLIVAYDKLEFLAAIAIKEFLEREGLRVLLADVQLKGPQSIHLENCIKSEGMMAISITAKSWTTKLLETKILQAIVARSHKEIYPFGFLLALNNAKQITATPSILQHLKWEWSFNALCEEIKQICIGRGWQPKVPIPSEKTENQGRSMNIDGSRNIQVGGNIQSTGDGNFKV